MTSSPVHLPLDTVRLAMHLGKGKDSGPGTDDGVDTQEQTPPFLHREGVQWLDLCW